MIQGVVRVDATPVQDERGAFYRAFCDHELEALLRGKPIRQVNVSRTRAVGAIRGLHYQRPPKAEIKLVRCLRGRVWDVAVDLRQNSPTFLKWHAEELSGENHRMLVVPEGCAHGFQVLEPDSELLYLHTAPYDASTEGGVRHNDPAVSISWPVEATELSARDRSHPLLAPEFTGVAI